MQLYSIRIELKLAEYGIAGTRDGNVIIDNNAVYTDRMDRLLLCPDYNYAVFENLLHGIPMNARKHPVIQQQLLTH